MRRDLLILIAAFALLVAFVALGPAQADRAPGQRGTTHSSGDAGALALYRWLADLGYQAERLEYRAFAPEGDLIFLLAPSAGLGADEADALLGWVEEGGTLVLAEDQPGGGEIGAVLRRLDMRLVPAADEWIAEARVLQPALGQPALSRLRADTPAAVAAEAADVAALAGAGGEAVLVGQQRGRGYVYVSSTLAPFSNAGLRDPDHAALVLNLLRRAPPGGRVLFDEVHHGFVREPGLRDLLLGSPWGWAIVYALLVAAAYVAAGGRRFGRPVPLREEVARRSSAEYLESMAGLLRRGGKRAYVGQHYRSALKRRLARPLGVSPALDDDAFVAEVAAARPIDAPALRELLARLGGPDLSEPELLRLVSAADALLARR